MLTRKQMKSLKQEVHKFDAHDAAKIVVYGCWHNTGYHDASMCKECKQKVLKVLLDGPHET